jgi:protein involved in polysaccharide export with SLBB domain
MFFLVPPREISAQRSGLRAQAARLTAALCFVALALIGCKSPGPAMNTLIDEINTTYAWSPEIVAVGDVLAVRFAENATWDHSVTVRPDGSATFLGLPAVGVAGLGFSALETQLNQSYAPKLSVPPRISVQLGTREKPHVLVMGEVENPGEVLFDGNVNFAEALALAGGPLKRTAYLENTLLIRWVPAESRQRVWMFDASREQWKTGPVLRLQPDDVLFVPNTSIDVVNIWVDQYLRLMIPFPYLIPPSY